MSVGFRRCGTVDLSVVRRLYGDSITAMQMLWPDTANRLLGEEGFEGRFVVVQRPVEAND